MARPDGERIATLEQHMVDQDKMLSSIATDVKEVKLLLNKFDGYETRLKEAENDIQEMKRARNGLTQWINPLIAAVLASTGTFLVINYLQNSK